MTELLPGEQRSWREFVSSYVQTALATGADPHAPTLAAVARDEMPFRMVGDCAYQAVYDQVGRTLRARKPKGRDRVRVPDGDGRGIYVTHEQAELPGFIEYVRDQLALRDAVYSGIIREVERWLAVHADCDLTVADIIQRAEQAPAD